MILTLELLFNSPQIISAVIDRVQQAGQDRIVWKNYLEFEQTLSRTFKTYLGTTQGVVMGSVIDKNSQKPIRERRSIGSGVGEVAYLGNSYQLDNERLDIIQQLINKFNSAGEGQPAVLNEIIGFLADDIRQCTLAPHKRMDYVVGQLLSTGKAEVKLGDNPNGIELIDLEIPVMKKQAQSADKNNFITYLKNLADELRSKVGTYGVIAMTRSTFNKRITASKEFQNSYKMLLGSAEIGLSGGLISDKMASTLFTGIGLHAIQLVDDFVQKEDGGVANVFADERIAFLPAGKVGKMKWYMPYEATDRVPTKNYTMLEGGHFIATKRTEEGRFIEYGCEWLPDIANPHKITIVDTSTMG